MIVSDIEQMKRETKRIADQNNAVLRIGYYKGYHGNELSEAVADFSLKYPTVDVKIMVGSHMYIEISNHNPLSRLDQIEISELKNTPCILVINSAGQQEERIYYEDVVGIKGDFLFADSIQEARLKIITGQGYMPVDVIGSQAWFDSTIDRSPLVRNGEPVRKTYCAFWRKDNSRYYIEDFAEILKAMF